ncbi:hypothetical protein [Desertibacillus haloalkaliphilus]|uniref:hypothetical protein n=1 Tax=Desertibacillus haloalkaliphilus TaxID=1328930 RepID=UPI001C2652B9|nr:hypothetical protein [Desertibacillus haloalkaliphilus]MBU8908902.1 hypothetical protein [Desertibacillus haloalkaliphilus]
MEKEKCKAIYKGVMIGSLVGTAVLFANRSSRTKIINGVKEVKDTSTETLRYLNDNCDEIINEVKRTATTVSELAQDAGEDFKKISESVRHLKESSAEVIDATQGFARELKQIKQRTSIANNDEEQEKS